MMALTRYQHRQTSLVLVLGVGAVLAAVAIGAALEGDTTAALLAFAYSAVVVGVVAAFSSLRTEVTAHTLAATFRFGWPRRRIALGSIRAHRPVRNRWWYGLGIRLVPQGWMYNVWGLDAVQVDYVDDQGAVRGFRIGTDDPSGLSAAIAEATGLAPGADISG